MSSQLLCELLDTSGEGGVPAKFCRIRSAQQSGRIVYPPVWAFISNLHVGFSAAADAKPTNYYGRTFSPGGPQDGGTITDPLFSVSGIRERESPNTCEQGGSGQLPRVSKNHVVRLSEIGKSLGHK